MKARKLAIVGATGAVGQEMLKVLEKRDFPYDELVLLASARSAGKKITFRGTEFTVQELTESAFEGIDLALFSAGGSITKKFAPAAVKSGTIVVDNSSAYRMDPEVPLIVPEINPEDAKKHKGILANPNCSTIIMLMAVYPIYKLYGVKRLVVSTYQAASGAGAAAMQELEDQAKAMLAGDQPPMEAFPFPLAFNVFSHNSSLYPENGFNQEEVKMVKESHKILGSRDLKISPTCIRVGTFRAHAESIHLELEKAGEMEAIRQALSSFPGVQLKDDTEKNHFPMPLEVSGQDDVYVGRLRWDLDDSEHKNLQLFCVGDQLLKGAALNAVQIAEIL
ncbi:MAG: aspartate-semialdehyde dehydrogenase [Leptospiraceae bacterium]|nr:aspartate-semialdehyde dehydrogenase [Leptospiraceae bacterium]